MAGERDLDAPREDVVDVAREEALDDKVLCPRLDPLLTIRGGWEEQRPSS